MAARLPPRKRSLFLPMSSNSGTPGCCTDSADSAMSPMTELAVNFHYNVSCEGSTPRRRLSLSDCKTTPTPKSSKCITSNESLESGIEVDSFSNASSLDDSPSYFSLQSKRSFNAGKIRRKQIFRCSSSSPGTTCEPLWFREARTQLDKENSHPSLLDRSTGESKHDSEVVKINRDPSLFHPIEDIKCRKMEDVHEVAPFDLNRSLSAPPALDSLEQYFQDMKEEDDDGDGFSDFIDDDMSSDNGSLPNSFSGLFNNPFIRNECKETSAPLSISQKNQGNKENENQDCSSLPCEIIFRRPKNAVVKSSRSLSFSIKRQEAPRDYSPVSRKRLKQRSQSVYQMSPMALRHVPEITSPLRIIRSHSLESKESPSSSCPVVDADERNLIGDQSREYCLPTIKGQHSDLKCINPETLSKLMDNDYVNVINDYMIVDCRYPYEYEAGHIKGAVNIYTKEDAVDYFLKMPKFKADGTKSVLIFHCEFSSKRGPNMSRFLRNKDRDLHRHCYPKLYYPEIYILNGGYKEFYNCRQEYCDPVEYLPMADTRHAQQLRFFAKRSKSWSENSTALRHRTGLRY